ncbi:MAG: PSP1 domain-containing protein [Planctomycetaceae bacterium]
MGATRQLTATVRHGCNSCRTGCKTTAVPDAKRGDKLVVQTERGLEYALVLTDPAEAATGSIPVGAEAVRHATRADLALQEELDAGSRSTEFRHCQALVEKLKLPMKLVRVERILGGGRLTFYFFSEERVDFRDLVRELAREYHMRIELKQIGARDEAKLLGDVSFCGRELCCSSWIRDMKPVTMKMAKNQKSTLDPSKISGMCGRLLCCLRYEDEVYTELRKELPPRGTRVRILSTEALGVVLNGEVLTQKCLILLDRGGTGSFPVSDLEREGGPGVAQGRPSPPRQPPAPGAAGSSEPLPPTSG